MEGEPPQPPLEDDEIADVIPFPGTALGAAIRRHPAHGHETSQETINRLEGEDDPDEPDDA